jgi:hypothetical protein
MSTGVNGACEYAATDDDDDDGGDDGGDMGGGFGCDVSGAWRSGHVPRVHSSPEIEVRQYGCCSQVERA